MPKWLKIYMSGVMMGAADVIPGVSGGTIAFILGVYDRLIAALSGVNKQSLTMLIKGDIKALWRHFDGAFLLPLGAGIATSIVGIAGLITHLLATYPEYVWSFFFGLILASAYFLIGHIERFSFRHFLTLVLGIVIGASLSLVVPIQVSTTYSMVFFSGFIAICAMILPGISGSFLLLMMGMYGFILGAVKDFNFAVIGVFAVGALAGLLSFSKVLQYLLEHAKSLTLSALIGIMVGALVKVWPWKVVDSWTQIGSKKFPVEEHLILPWHTSSYHLTTDLLLPIGFMIIGFMIVFLISYIFLRNADK